jgi:endonuclease/exonuclease/phosphatase family metal-dependent hydrolase
VSIVVSWNVAGRVRSVPQQAVAVADQPADVIALQEVRLTSMGAWRTALRELGYEHIITTLDQHDPLVKLEPDRRLGVLLAARERLHPVEGPDVPWPERVLVARVEFAGETVEICNLHSPISSKRDQVKVRTLEAAAEYLAAPSDTPRVLVGDLNTPQYESREGEVSSFARTRSGRIRPDYGERHDRAELGIVVGLTEHGYRDAFRALHGYSRRDRSWLYPHRKMGYRLDHVLVRGLEVQACEYRHDWRDAKLSDHAGIWAELAGA